MKIYVPGNLLLLGEYAVTLNKGMGVAVAIEPCITIEVKPADKLTVTCTFQGESYTWHQGNPLPCQLKLFGMALKEVISFLSEKKLPPHAFRCAVHIDSSALSYPNGRKKGFGSSAAVAAGITYALLRQALGREPDREIEVFPTALKIHRAFQEGKGSGYDVLASIMGGAGLFIGGPLPIWRPLDPLWLKALYLMPGDSTSSTHGALQRFDAFRRAKAAKAEKFEKLSNRLAEKFAYASTLDGALRAFRRASYLNRWIHTQLHLSAEEPGLRMQLDFFRKLGCAGKPLGAGGEIAAVLAPYQTSLEPINISKEGIRCTP